MSNQEVIAAVRAHHDQMAAEVTRLSEQVRDGARRGYARSAGQALDAWCRDDLLPHALAEEGTLYAAAAKLPQAALLVEAMTADHRSIRSAVDGLSQVLDAVDLVTAAAVVESAFHMHLAKENDQLLPALDAAGVDLAPLVEGMEEILGGDDGDGHAHHDEHVPGEDGGCGCGGHGHGHGGCGCGGHGDGHAGHGHDHGGDGPVPAAHPAPESVSVTTEIHPQALPHESRHQRILGAVESLRVGEGLVLAADHDPRPVGRQVASLWPDQFTWTYLEDGPDQWRVLVARAG